MPGNLFRRIDDLITRVAQQLERVCLWLLATGFGLMIATIALQVASRNLLKIPVIWTLDLAQLLFSWLIFLGAAVAFRRGGHYAVDIIPERWAGIGAAVNLLGHLFSAAVIFVLVYFGWNFTRLGFTRSAPALEISEAWYFLPIPLSGALMAFFLLEAGLKLTGPKR